MIIIQFAEKLFNKMIKISQNLEGSEYQNRNPKPIDQQFYDFIKKETSILK
jgi:hypothetical protein